MVAFLMLKVAMARGRRLKKRGGGELEVDKKNVTSVDQGIIEQIVASTYQRIVQQIVVSPN
jgi:hypothetical protein